MSSPSEQPSRPVVLPLDSPDPATALQRHAFDVVRYGMTASPDSPPGIYWDAAADELVFFGPSERSHTPQSDGPKTPEAPGSPMSVPVKITDDTEGNLSELRISDNSIDRHYLRTPHEITPHVSEGSYIRMEIPQIMDYPKRQAYTVDFTIPQDKGSNVILDSLFRLQVDTGSSESWILGQPLWEQLGDGTGVPFTEKRLAKSDTSFHAYYLNHGFHYGKTPGYRVDYLDNSRARLGLPDHIIPFNTQVYNIAENHTFSELHMESYFGIAFAVNIQLVRDAWDGILGLALNKFQVAFAKGNPSRLVPSFFFALQRRIPRSPIRYENSMYFNLWAPMSRVKGHYSWLAFNQWPCKTIPRWSNKISVQPVLNERATASWIVHLQEIGFQSKEEGNPWQDLPNGRIPCDVDATLDTGASLTYLPSNVVQTIRCQIFGNPPLTSDGAQSPSDLFYTVDEMFFDGALRYQIVLKFTGAEQPVVSVPLSLSPFVCSRPFMQTSGDYEGLIFSMDQFGSRRAILGLNFFQAALVALCSVDTPEPDKPGGYVKLAVKYRNDSSFDLPPQAAR